MNFPFAGEARTGRLVVGLIVTSWTLCIIATIIPPVLNTWSPGVTDCTTATVFLPAVTYFLLTYFSFLLAATVILYIRIAMVALRHQRELRHQTSNREGSQSKVTKMLLTILTIYLLSLVPYIVVYIVKSLYHRTGFEPLWVQACTRIVIIFTLVGSLLNPIIYAWKNKAMRTVFCRLLHVRGSITSENKSSHKGRRRDSRV